MLQFTNTLLKSLIVMQASTSMLNRFQIAHQLLCGIFGVNAAGCANPEKFHKIKPTFSQFKSRDKASFPFQLVSQPALSQPCLFSHGNQHLAEAFTLMSIDRLFHARNLRANFACFQNAGMF